MAETRVNYSDRYQRRVSDLRVSKMRALTTWLCKAWAIAEIVDFGASDELANLVYTALEKSRQELSDMSSH